MDACQSLDGNWSKSCTFFEIDEVRSVMSLLALFRTILLAVVICTFVSCSWAMY